MKSKLLLLTIVISFLANILVFAQADKFKRSFEIPVPNSENTGFGEFIAGVDFDGDGKKEIYAVNNMLDQGGDELIPRMYKFEFDGQKWDSVWSTIITNIPQQNSWAALTTGDLDNDGKPEIIWGPTNNFNTENTNPPRILVFEYPGDGSDAMGVDVFGNYAPNAEWTISDQNNQDLRPFKWFISDVDSDGQNELCFGDRSSSSAYHFGVVSVTDIPDNGDGSETWTMEHSGLGLEIDASNIYDFAVLDNTLIIIHSNGIVDLVSYNNGAWEAPVAYPDMMPGGSWKTANVVDVDGDGTDEIVVGGWSAASNNLYILKIDSFAGLTSTAVADMSPFISDGGRLNGGSVGDIDQDGKMDIVFGTRGAIPNGAIVRVEFTGNDLKSPESYSVSVIDSLLSESVSQRFDVVKIANVDDDPELEVLYTDGNQTGKIPIAVLDLQVAVSVENFSSPGEYFLDQNYPNPFNPSTSIRFGLNEQSTVDLRIYDILGREIAVLINNQMKSAGTYNVDFSAGNLSSGTYVYRLKTDNFVEARKMILIK